MTASRVISLRLKPPVAKSLERLARIFQRSLGETASILLEEKLREEQFPFVEFRDSPIGRQAYVKGSSLAVWEVVMVGRGLDLDAAKVALYLEWRQEWAESALAYAREFAHEIDPIVDEVESFTIEDLRRIVPWAREVEV